MPHQTGPVTATGRASAAMNSLTHGATSKTLFIAGDNPAEFFALLEDAFTHHQPTNGQDSDLVTDTVFARWFLKRRQAILLSKESRIYERNPEGGDWMASEVNELHTFDRYVTTASRALGRAMANVRHIRKEAQSEQRWQAQHALQKERFALQRERFELAKQKEERLAARQAEKELKQQQRQKEPKEEPMKNPPFPSIEEIAAMHLAEEGSNVQQTLFIGIDEDNNNATIIYEVTPSNEKIRHTLSENDQITRVYNFVGGVPSEYKHLITPDAISWGVSTSVRKVYSAQEWSSLANTE